MKRLTFVILLLESLLGELLWLSFERAFFNHTKYLSVDIIHPFLIVSRIHFWINNSVLSSHSIALKSHVRPRLFHTLRPDISAPRNQSLAHWLYLSSQNWSENVIKIFSAKQSLCDVKIWLFSLQR